MQPRRHRLRKDQRRDSARGWVRTNPTVTVGSYARRYGVDRYTAYEDLTAIGFVLPVSAQRWSTRPPAVPRRRKAQPAAEPLDDSWTVIDGRMYFVAGYTSGGAPYGVFVDEMTDDPGGDPDRWTEPLF